MKHKTSIRIQFVLQLVVLAWIALGVTAAYLIEGQPGWFALSLAFLLATVTGSIAELRLARAISESLRESAQTVVEVWPHVIAMLEDLERIEPERAEMVGVAKLEMVNHLERSRVVAAGRLPSARELLRRKRSAP